MRHIGVDIDAGPHQPVQSAYGTISRHHTTYRIGIDQLYRCQCRNRTKSVIVPLEEAINGVENMTYMTSTATNNGSGSITVYFKQGTDPDMATINTKNRVSEAEGLLPAEVTKIGVTVEKGKTVC